jgi:N-succinyldiaminopimelate aminotransferase
MQAIADLCIEHDVIAICDEVYEEITFGPEHLRLATFPGMAERTVTMSSVGKTYSLTGWKVGWAVAPAGLTSGMRAAHQYMTFTTPTPVQHGTVAALGAPEAFYEELRSQYRALRDLLARGLSEIGFEVHMPEGTYFLLAGYGAFSDEDDRSFARRLTTDFGVATVPPGVFYHDPKEGQGMTRFAFCKRAGVLMEALDRLRQLEGGSDPQLRDHRPDGEGEHHDVDGQRPPDDAGELGPPLRLKHLLGGRAEQGALEDAADHDHADTDQDEGMPEPEGVRHQDQPDSR